MTFSEFLNRPWPKVSRWELVGGLAGIGVLSLLILTANDGWIPVLNDADLIFHEAGHVVYGLFGSTPALYGGTLGQLSFPLAAGASFWARRQVVATALCAAWFFENFFNIARYMADARAQLLPLVGCDGGPHCHDWRRIFIRWGALQSDTLVAAWTRVLGWAGLILTAAWLLWRWKEGQHEPTEEEVRLRELLERVPDGGE